MLDPKLLRSDLTGVAAALARRGFVLDVTQFAAFEEQRKGVQMESDRLRAERNANAKAVGIAKSKGEDAAPLLARAEALVAQVKVAEERLEALQAEINGLALGLPNILHSSVPDGRDETANVEVRRWGEPRVFSFDPKDHVALGEPMGMDFEAAGRISGSRFVVMTGPLARLHRAPRAVHVGYARARSWLSRGLCALSGARRRALWHGSAAQIRAGPVRRARRPGFLSDSHRRSAADQSGPGSDCGARAAAAEIRRALALFPVRGRGARQGIKRAA